MKASRVFVSPAVSHKFMVMLGISLLVSAAVMFIPGSSAANAQCGAEASSCINCHEGEQAFPVKEVGQWHIDHAANDFCQICHGGDKTSKDHTVAHTGLFDPLGDQALARCTACHPADAQQRRDTYSDLLLTFQPPPPNESDDAATTTAAPVDDGYDIRNIGLAGFAGALTMISGMIVWNLEDIGARLRREDR